MGKRKPKIALELKKELLSSPIPNMDKLRVIKAGYNNYPIGGPSEYYDEPVVNIADYGLAGQAYYSRPNVATDEPVPGASTDLYLRKSLAEKLSQINEALDDPYISDFFGGEVELYVEDALRPVALQKELHDTFIPALLKRNHPDISKSELAEKIKNIIAIPSSDPLHPSPHVTGGAVDVILRYKQVERGYVNGCNVPMGHLDSETSERIKPDYFETTTPLSDEDRLFQRNRRAYYAIMTGKAFGIDTQLVNNPTEWWHWSFGDQMWAKLRDKKAAFYSVAKI
jgi:D-alanyl-D-alanine dipeptidase